MDCKKEVLPFTAMAAVECINVALNTIFKAAAFKGLSYWVFVAYVHLIGTLVLLPLPFIFPRSYIYIYISLSLFFGIDVFSSHQISICDLQKGTSFLQLVYLLQNCPS